MNDLIFKHKTTLNGHLGAVYGMCEGPGHGFFSVGGDGYVVFWPNELHENGKLIARSNKALYCCHYLPLQNLLVCGGLEGILYIIDLKQNKIISTTQIGVLPIYSIISSATHILSAHGDGILYFWKLDSYSVENKIQLTRQAIRTLLPDGDFLYAGASDGFIYQLNADSQIVLHFFPAHEMSVFALAKSGQFLYSGGRDAQMKIWDTQQDYLCQTSINAHMGTINSLCLMDDWLVSAGRDKTIRIWNKDGQLAESKNSFAKGHFHSVNKVIMLPKTRELVSCSDDKTIILWEPVN
ncbi:MAG: hypothetical protein IPH94_08805 [Saprospiraceae bacterium]|nr:hypothetical protein [Saprospiraceae bacterium]MBK8851701.1 hypothetical protein [Saprospiraceae bacterium]